MNTRCAMVLLLAAATMACDGSTEPAPPRDLAINTMAVSLRSASIEFQGVVEARAYFQHVTTGEGTGLRIEAEPGGHPLVIHVPGAPATGRSALGPWDPAANTWRADTIPVFVGRMYRVGFGGWPAASLAERAVLDGQIALDSVRLPEYRLYSDVGRLRGSMEARAVTAAGDTVQIDVEFSVELSSLHDGWAEAALNGPAGFRSAPQLIGSGNTYHRSGYPSEEPQFVAILLGEFADTGERVYVWFGTTLTGPGQVQVQRFISDSIFRVRNWPDHFVAGVIGEPTPEGRTFVAVDGALEFDEFEEEVYGPVARWGVAKGRFTGDLDVRNSDGGVDRTAAVINFNVPRYWIVSVESGPPPTSVLLPPGR